MNLFSPLIPCQFLFLVNFSSSSTNKINIPTHHASLAGTFTNRIRDYSTCFVTGGRNRAFLVLAETDFRTASCPRIEVSQYSSSSPEGENEKSRRRIKRKVHEKREGSPRTHRPVKLRQPAFNAHGLRSPVGQCAGTSQRVPTALQGIGLTLMTQTFLRPAHGTPQLLCAPCPSPPAKERERERELGRLQEITPKNIPTSAGGDRWNLPQPVCPLRDPHREKTGVSSLVAGTGLS